MGVNHFKLTIIPRAYFERAGLPVPSMITAEDIDSGESVDIGWWASLQPSAQALVCLRTLCPTDKSWGETEEYVTGEAWGSDLRIWKEQGRVWQMTFRFSPTADDRTLLDQFIAIARGERWLLLDSDTGSLFEPDDAVVAECLRNSRAMRFVREPLNTLIEASKETER